MNISPLDWYIIAGFFVFSLIIGMLTAKKSSESSSEFFLSGRNMPWWLLGISMVATTFSADTPNFVTNVVRTDGVSGNWVWWIFLLTGMLTVFVYANLWRRSGVLTDLEFYELRYSGKPAAFLRGFRAIYLGVFFNVMIMATVCLAAIKIGSAMLGFTPLETLLIASIVTVVYAALGGLRGVIITDFFQFIMAMVGSIWAAYEIVNMPGVESLDALLQYDSVIAKMSILPDFNNSDLIFTMLIIPLAVQWWSVWYPGAEPGGGGYVAQRMLAAKDERNAMGATLLFNFAHYALRPWPWILIALASLVMFPLKINEQRGDNQIAISVEAQGFLDQAVSQSDLGFLSSGITYQLDKLPSEAATQRSAYERLQRLVSQNSNSLEIKSLAYIFAQKNRTDGKAKDNTQWTDPLQEEQLVYLHLANPNLEISKLGHDLAYPSMLNFLPKGLLGLVLASLIAAFMSTLSTHLNWGASYIANDWYKRFMKPRATEKDLVRVGRISTILLMAMAAVVALWLSDALQAFNILLQIGAGTGLIFILRWFWWRINAYSEITGMVVSFLIAIYFEFFHADLGFEPLANHLKLVTGVGLTTLAWILVTLLTRPTSYPVLLNFYRTISPAKVGWTPIVNRALKNNELQERQVSSGQLPLKILGMVVGCFTVYGALFATGFWIYNNQESAIIATVVAVVGTITLYFIWRAIKLTNMEPRA